MKLLPNGIAVIKGDTHISAWVIEHNKLNIAEEMLAPYREYAPTGSTVVDVGASIGDHTVTYAQWVGKDGLVVAFEPHAEAYECLLHNTESLSQVFPINSALSDIEDTASLVSLTNAGASYLDSNGYGISTLLLDNFELSNVSFVKIDAEGFETRILRGSVKTISKYRPVMLLEVNRMALERAGSSVVELIDLLVSMKYGMCITDYLIPWSAPQYDILCLPTENPLTN